jgi:hypothetical protein
MRKTYKIVRETQGNCHLGDLNVDGRILLQMIIAHKIVCEGDDWIK